MKKMGTYPPLQMIRKVTQRRPSIWEEIAQAASRQQAEEPLWRPDIYITAQNLEKGVLKLCQRGPEKIESIVAAVLSVLASWRRTKEVYRFAPEMERLLYQQADCRLPVSVLLHLPYSSFYIETPQLMGDRYHGFFLSLDQSIGPTGEKVKLLRFYACCGSNTDGINEELIELPLEEGKSLIEEIIAAAARAATFVQVSIKDAESFLLQYIAQTTVILTKLCQLVLYITAQNADLLEHGRPAKVGSGLVPAPSHAQAEIKDKYREIRGWEVGYRIVDKMKAAKREQTAQEKKENRGQSERVTKPETRRTRMSPVPHLRCGHWQTFWTGRREPGNPNRKLLLKWVAPTFVNCGHDQGARLPVTINRYRA